MASKEKTTLYLDGKDYHRLKALARAQNRPVAELVREAVAEYATRHAAPTMPSSLGTGHSGRNDLSELAENLLDGIGENR